MEGKEEGQDKHCYTGWTRNDSPTIDTLVSFSLAFSLDFLCSSISLRREFLEEIWDLDPASGSGLYLSSLLGGVPERAE